MKLSINTVKNLIKEIGNKKIILADEPTGNLDEENSQVIFEYLKETLNAMSK